MRARARDVKRSRAENRWKFSSGRQCSRPTEICRFNYSRESTRAFAVCVTTSAALSASLETSTELQLVWLYVRFSPELAVSIILLLILFSPKDKSAGLYVRTIAYLFLETLLLRTGI